MLLLESWQKVNRRKDELNEVPALKRDSKHALKREAGSKGLFKGSRCLFHLFFEVMVKESFRSFRYCLDIGIRTETRVYLRFYYFLETAALVSLG